MEITKKRAEKCVTHHLACDCREYRFQEMERALRIIHTWAGFLDTVSPDEIRDLCDKALERVIP